MRRAGSTLTGFDHLIDRRGTHAVKWQAPDPRGHWHDIDGAGGSLLDVRPLPMWLADMEFSAPPVVLDALRARLDHGVLGYSSVDEAYHRAIVTWMSRRHGWQVEPEWILTTFGVMPAINLLIQTFTAPGDGVIVQSPVFHPISQAVEYNARTLLVNPLRREAERYAMDFADLERRAADPRARMLVLCSPHNPVGRVWTVEELRRLLAICEAHDLLLVSDEIHGDLTYGWARFRSAGAVDARFLDRLVVCTGPSKAFNLPALKTSLTLIPDAGLRERFQLTLRNQNALFGTNLLGTVAIQAAYEHGEPWLDGLMAYLTENLRTLETFLHAHLPALRVVRPEGLYLVWIDTRDTAMDTAALVGLLKDEAGVWVEPGTTYGPEGEGYIRLNIGCARAMLDEALDRIRIRLGST